MPSKRIFKREKIWNKVNFRMIFSSKIKGLKGKLAQSKSHYDNAKSYLGLLLRERYSYLDTIVCYSPIGRD
jgi:hypothetical protein